MRRHRLTYADVVATVALLLAMSGSAYAITMVTSKHIADHTIQSIDISDAAMLDLLPDARYAVAYDGGSIGGTGLATITQVFVNPGNWAVSGKLGVTNEGSSPAMVLCVLTTGQFVDRTWAYLGPAGSSSEREAESFILAFASPSEQMVSISCDPHGGQVHIYDATILTTQVGALS